MVFVGIQQALRGGPPMKPLGNLQIDVPHLNRMRRKRPFNNSLARAYFDVCIMG